MDELGLQVLIDTPKPVLPSPTFRCSDWFNKINPVCENGSTSSRSFQHELHRPVMQILIELGNRFTNVTLWDPFPSLCPGQTCSAFGPHGKPLFFDGDHLSGHGADLLYPEFLEVLAGIWGAPNVQR